MRVYALNKLLSRLAGRPVSVGLLSEREAQFMLLLEPTPGDLAPERFGMDLIRAAKMTRGAGYTPLQRLEDKGYLASRRERDAVRGGIPRRYYRATPKGRAALAAWRAVAAHLVALADEQAASG